MLMSLNSSPCSPAWRVVLGWAVLSPFNLSTVFLCRLETDAAQMGPRKGHLVPAHTRN